MRLPHPPTGTRFFAQVLAAVCECPRCGQVLAFSSRPGRRRGAGKWDRATSTLECPYCGLRGLLGLLWWPRRPPGGGPTTAGRDQVPAERQLAQLRAMAGGLWMPQEQAKKAFRPEETNVTAACSCREGTENTSQQDPTCPVHGVDQQPGVFMPPEED